MRARLRSAAAQSSPITDEQLRAAYHDVQWVLHAPLDSSRAVANAAARMREAAASMGERQRKRADGDVKRVVLAGRHLFDYLLLEETEREEVHQERTGRRLTDEDLARRLAKHPIKLALNHTGFYGAAGMCLGLCDYTGPEVVHLFRATSPDAFAKGDRECSRARSALRKSMIGRFARVAITESCPRPHEHLQRLRREIPTPRCLALMKEGLARFGPSSIEHVVPAGYRFGTPLIFSEDRDVAELQKIHVFFDVECYDRLARGLGVDSFDVRARMLTLRNDPPPADLDPASDEDGCPLSHIRALIEEQVARVQHASRDFVRIRVDGIDRAAVNAVGQSAPMLLEENASVVEIVGEADGVEAILATYVLTYDGPKRERWEVPLPWSDRERILCTFDYSEDDCVGALFERVGRAAIYLSDCARSTPTKRAGDSAHLFLGDKVGDYTIQGFLGAGAFGEVYAARRIPEPPVALKVLIGHQWNDDSFVNELLKAALRLHHPNIAETYDFVRVSHTPVVISELLDGMTLHERLAREPIAPAYALKCADQILAALEHAHERGIVHRDLKPSNILLMHDDTLKVTDFGVAPSLYEPLVALRMAAREAPDYLAPEQVAGLHVDRRVDVFSCGAVLYEMLTGQHPFASDAVPVPPAEINPTLPCQLNDVILKSLEQEPGARFQSADAFRGALSLCHDSLAHATRAATELEQRLLTDFQAGDTAAFDLLYRRYGRWVHGCVIRLGLESTDVANGIFAALMFDRDHFESRSGLRDRLWHFAQRTACRISPERRAEEVDRMILTTLSAGADSSTASSQEHWMLQHLLLEDEIESLVDATRETEKYDPCTAVQVPQDWRQVAPLARSLAGASERYTATQDVRAVEELIAATDRKLPALTVRPSLRATVRSLMGRLLRR